MIVYNITIKIEIEAHDSWLEWMTESHIPDVLSTGLFASHKIFRLLEQDESEGITYVIQYFCNDMDSFQIYENQFATQFRDEHTEMFKDRFVAFRTLMETVN